MKLNTNLPTRRRTLNSPSSRSALREGGNHFELTQIQLAFKVLEMYTDLLCQKDNSTNIHKFARTVTNKVKARSGISILADGASGSCTFSLTTSR